jgi:hypothetical protein
MAPDLRHWVGGTLAACAIVAIAAVSGGGAVARQSEGPPQPAGTRWGDEALRLGNAWRLTWRRLQLERYRGALAKQADSARAAGGTAPLVLVDGPSTAAQRAELNGYLAEMWRSAAPEGFKVAVALVIDRGKGPALTDAPSMQRGQSTQYLFPDSLHRDLCVAVVRDQYNSTPFFDPRRTKPLGLSSEIRWIAQGLGPCAFYGAFGVPSRQIEGWLQGDGHQFAMYPRWWLPRGDEVYNIWWDQSVPIARQSAQWWSYVYSMLPWRGVACYGGRVGSCASAVYDTIAVATDPPGDWDSFQWWREQALFGSPYYLSDLAGALGTERFSRFWTADVPMDSAVQLASGETLDQWTGEWARHRGMRLTLGATAPPLDTASGLLTALLALGAALWYARRRQIG